MSYQKKSVILQELEQAIRKKAQQKSRNKEHFGRVLQSSVEKKKNVLKTTANKDHRVGSTQKKENQKVGEKHLSLFNNQAMPTTESHEFKIKKYNNRRFDKLVSLIQYMVSSSEKVVKYISSNNFQAEFALKLYRSDKDNLLNQVKNFNIQDLIDSNRDQESSSQQSLIEENNKLKKQLMVLEKEAERFHKESAQEKEYTVRGLQKEVGKLREMVRKLVSFDNFRQLMELLEKENKFQTMSLKCQENSRKITEIEIVITSLGAERNEILENIGRCKNEAKTDRGQKIIEIQSQKEKLQKQISTLRNKITQLKQSSNSIAEFQSLRKNNQIIQQRIQVLANKLSNQSLSPNRKPTQLLVDYISEKVEWYIDNNAELEQQNNRLKGKVEKMQILQEELIVEKKQKQDELLIIEDKVNKLTSDLNKLKQTIQQITVQKEEAEDRLADSERMTINKDEQIDILKSQLSDLKDHNEEVEELKMQNSNLRQSAQVSSKRWQEKEKYFKQKIQKLQLEKGDLQEQISEAGEQISKLKSHLNEILRSSESKIGNNDYLLEKIKIEHESELNECKSRIKELEVVEKKNNQKYQKMSNSYQEINKNYQAMTQTCVEKQQRISQLQTMLAEMRETIQSFQEQSEDQVRQAKVVEQQLKNQILNYQKQCLDLNKQKEELSDLLKNTQDQMMKKSEGQEEMIRIKETNIRLTAEVYSFEKQLKNAEEINETIRYAQAEDKLKQKQLMQQLQTIQQKNQQITNEIEQIREQKLKIEKIMNQNISQQAGQFEDVSQKLQEAQLRILALDKDKVEYQHLLSEQKEKTKSLNEQIKKIEDKNMQLSQQLQVATDSSIVASEKDKQSDIEKKNMQNELQSMKQQLEYHSELSKFKIKQYNNLLKQILKGLNIQSEQIEDIETFEQLLEFGSKRVLQMRKQQREEESNKRKIGKKYESSEEGSPCQKSDLEDVKVQLFNNQSQKYIKQQQPENKELNIEEFNEMKAQESASMISEQDRCNLDEFNDLKSQKMNESMLSRDEQVFKKQQQQDANNLSDFKDISMNKANDSMISQEQPPVEQQASGNDLRDFKDMSEDKINDSMISQDEPPSKQQEKKENDLQDGQNLSDFKEMGEDPANESMMSVEAEGKIEKIPEQQEQRPIQMGFKPQIIDDVSQLSDVDGQLSTFIQKNVSQFNQSQINQTEQFNYSGPAVNMKASSKRQSNSSQQGKANLWEFMDAESQNVSIMSSKDKQMQKSIQSQKEKQAEGNSSSVVVYPIRKFKSKEEEADVMQAEAVGGSAANFDQFNNISGDQIDSSMMSEKEHNLSQFNQMPSEEMNSSMISNKEPESELEEQKMQDKVKEEQMGMDEFGQIQQDEVNESLLSEKEHGMSEFGDMPEEPNNMSILSQKSEHGLSEFGELENVNTSVISEADIKKEEISRQEKMQEEDKNQNKASSFDEFEQFGGYKLSQSMYSETGSKG